MGPIIYKAIFVLAFFWELFLKIILPILAGIAALIYGLLVSIPDQAVLPETVTDVLSLATPFVIFTGAIIFGVAQISRILSNPFQISIENFVRRPNYKEKLGFYLNFQEDFRNIVDVATQPDRKNERKRKLVIFIDDLDRCEAPKAADIIEAINLFLDSVGCVFILGMDSDAVIASFETKYSEMFAALRKNNPLIVSPGKNFLEKIIQIPFQVPKPTKQNVRNLVEDIIYQNANVDFEPHQPSRDAQKKTNSGPTQPKIEETQKIDLNAFQEQVENESQEADIASYEHKDVRSALQKGSELLTDNPRQAKRYINLFRLYIYIANERNLFQAQRVGNGKGAGIDLHLLAVWVAMLIRWPTFAKTLLNETETVAIKAFMNQLTQDIEDGEFLAGQSRELLEKELENYAAEGFRMWADLPLAYWLSDNDFVDMISSLKTLWVKPVLGGRDWLHDLISMSSITPSIDDNFESSTNSE